MSYPCLPKAECNQLSNNQQRVIEWRKNTAERGTGAGPSLGGDGGAGGAGAGVGGGAAAVDVDGMMIQVGLLRGIQIKLYLV